MKICMLNTLFPPNIVGGAEKSVSLLAATYVQKGHSVSVVSLHDAAEEKIEDWKGVRAYYLPIDNSYWQFKTSEKPSAIRRLWWHVQDMWNSRAAARIGRILDIEKPDVLHTHIVTGFSVAVWREAKKRNIKIVHTLRDYSLLCARSTLFNHGKFCEKRCASCWSLSAIKHAATAMVDHVISISRFTLNEHTKRGYFKKAQRDIIVNIADVTPAMPKRIQKNANGEIVFGFLGRVEDEKGVGVLLEACAQLPSTGWQLILAGRGRDTYVEVLKEKYKHLPIQWLGFVEADELYGKINVLIVPAIWPEPLSRTIIESAARGIPVLASDAGGQPELLALGLPGVVYPAYDVEVLAVHMRDILDGKGPFFDANANSVKPESWASHFSAEEITARNLATY